MSALAQLTLGTKDWLQRATNHRSNALEWTQPTRDRRARGEKHPVHDFLPPIIDFRWPAGALHPGLASTLRIVRRPIRCSGKPTIALRKELALQIPAV